MRPNHVLRSWRNGGQTVGAWLTVNSAFSAEVMAHQGFDWLCIDIQHGAIDYSDAMHMLQAISTTDTVPFVRVPWNDPATIMKVLDAGSYGVVVPLVNNRSEAEAAVTACRYPPLGIRSYGPVRAAIYGGPNYSKWANDEIACIVMIETAKALEHLDEIMSTPGVDVAYVGPSDLAYAVDLDPRGDNDDPKHAETVQRIFETAKRHGVATGIHTSSVEYASRYLKMGFQMVTLSADRTFMSVKAATDLAVTRDATGIQPLRPEV